ncbi:MAG: MacS family sensor histidine kinase [Nocardioidaceae bacterium]
MRLLAGIPDLASRVPRTDPVAEQVQTTLFRALAVLRILVMVYAVALNAARWQDFARPVLGWVVVAVIVVWTGVATWAYDDPRRRGLPLLVADFVVAAGTLLSTPYVESSAMLDAHAPTMPSFWVMVAVLSWAVARGWPVGLGAAVVMSLVDLSVRTSRTGTVWGNIFLLLLGAGVVGYAADLVQQASVARAEAERAAATMRERARLARVVHDGVLQVLALVARRGPELGGEAAELGRVAGEQEVALRGLVQGDAAVADRPTSRSAGGKSDLADALGAVASRTVTLSTPGGPVWLPAHVVDEVVAVVRAALSNVARHVGEQAPAWVLLEDRLDPVRPVRPGGPGDPVGPGGPADPGGTVVVTVRDAGPGIAEGRLEQAVAEGRLGVAESIRGRVADLGGQAVLTTAPGQGTEWELTVPARTGS